MVTIGIMVLITTSILTIVLFVAARHGLTVHVIQIVLVIRMLYPVFLSDFGRHLCIVRRCSLVCIHSFHCFIIILNIEISIKNAEPKFEYSIYFCNPGFIILMGFWGFGVFFFS